MNSRSPSTWFIRAACLGTVVLAGACGGGAAMHAGTPAPSAPPPPPPPPQAAAEPCAAPVTGDCVVDAPATPSWNEYEMTGGRDSDHQLIVLSSQDGVLGLVDGEYRFSGGTTVAGGTLAVHGGGVLVSDVEIQDQSFAPGGTLWLSGTVRGDVINANLLTTRHTCGTALNLCEEDPRSRIEGDYTQHALATLELVLGWELQVSGHADLDGVLKLIRGTSASYVLPDAGTSVLVLHADGGISDTFTLWRSETASPLGLFLEGELRYTDHDVWFDLTRISLAGAMAGSGASPAIVAAASNLDRAFAVADTFAGTPRTALDTAQRRFLDSAASIQSIADPGQANRTLDSLGGALHASLPAALQWQDANRAGRLDGRLQRIPAGHGAGSWQSAAAGGLAGGHEAWVDRNWLVGGRIAIDPVDAWSGPLAGFARGRSPNVGMHVHFRSDDGRWYATGSTAFGHAVIQARRTIDLAAGGLHPVESQRWIEHTNVHAEAGRRVDSGIGRWSPFVALDVAMQQGSGFTEQGDTGMELRVDPFAGRLAQAQAGVRYAYDWNRGAQQWLRIDAEARYARQLASSGLQWAAFAGTPDSRFPLPLFPEGRDQAAVSLGLAGGFARDWAWWLDYTTAFGAGTPGTLWAVGLRRGF